MTDFPTSPVSAYANGILEAVTDELLAHGEFSSGANNRSNAREAARVVIDMVRTYDLAQCPAVTAALQECVEVLELVEHPRREDPQYGAEVAALGDRIGYGALMSSASASWRKFLEAKGYPPGAEFVAGPCQATVTRALQMARAALSDTSTVGKCACLRPGGDPLGNCEECSPADSSPERDGK